MSGQHTAAPFRPGPSTIERRMAFESVTVLQADRRRLKHAHGRVPGQPAALLRRMVAAFRADEGREWDVEIHDLECVIAEALGKPQPVKPKERSFL